MNENLNTMNNEVKGVVRIGNGAKLHPAIKDPVYGVMICCSCPGTQQGAAYRRAQFLAGMTANCKN